MEKVIISEDKIQEFIAKNDKRNGARLLKYKDLIERLISNEISLNAIYEFILENDKEIGNKANFYKFMARNYPKSKTTTKTKTKEVTTTQISPTIPKLQSTKASDVLSQDFDLLAFPS